MKKVLFGILLLLICAYPAAMWYAGKQVEASLAERDKTLQGIPLIKVVKHDFQRGFIGATDISTYELFGELIDSVSKTSGKAIPDTIKPLRFTQTTRFKYGPYVEGRFAAAVADSVVALDPATIPEVIKIESGSTSNATHMVFGFDGAGEGTSETSKLTVTVGSPSGDGVLVVDPIKLSSRFTNNMQSFTVAGGTPKVTISGPEDTRFELSDLHIDNKQTRLFEDVMYLFTGTQSFSIGEIQVQAKPATDGGPKTVAIKDLVSSSTMTASAGKDFLDTNTKLSVGSVMFDNQEYGPANEDVSFKHLHARSFVELLRRFVDIYSDPEKLLKPGADPMLVMAPITESAFALLKYDPELSIDRISFTTPQGETVLHANAQLHDAKPEDFSNAVMLSAMIASKLKASADISMPEVLLAQSAAAAAAKSPQAKTANFAQQMDLYAQQGLIVRDGKMVTSKVEFSRGELIVNGKPYNPMAALAQPQTQKPPSAAPGLPADDQMVRPSPSEPEYR